MSRLSPENAPTFFFNLTPRKLVGELEKLQAQLDTWALGSADPSEEARLDVLEAGAIPHAFACLYSEYPADARRALM